MHGCGSSARQCCARCRQAKLDALSGLAAAAEAYGAEAMAPHWPGICRALRREILAAAAPSLDAGSRDAELANAATRCLRTRAAANSRYTLLPSLTWMRVLSDLVNRGHLLKSPSSWSLHADPRSTVFAF